MAFTTRFPCLLVCLILTQAARASSEEGHSKRTDCSSQIVVGVDYYPEQWPEQEMHADLLAIKHDLGADLIRIGEFMWHEIEPSEGNFNFTKLDSILDAAEQVGLKVMLGTPTATMPAWLYTGYPDVVSQGPDSPDGYAAARPGFGGRRQYSFNSKVYREHVRRVVEALAERYGERESITLWQVDNEIGHEGSDLDFSNSSLIEWRAWLHRRFAGSIEKLNSDWGTVFWGVTYNNFDEIPLPRYTVPGGPARPNQNFRSNSNPGMLLDFRRFRRDSITQYADMQVEILRAKQVKGCVTTNAPGGFWGKAMDHNDLFSKMDLPSYDNYPVWGGSTDAPLPSTVALLLDVVRGFTWGELNQTGWMVAEQLIGAQGHDIIGYTPRPGQVKAWAAAAFLHGATGMAFFRYRAAVFGQEQFCYGILDHSTPRSTGRKWREAKDVYLMARQQQDLWLSPIQAQVAVLYDVENIFAWQAQPQSVDFNFESEVHRLYYPFWRNGAAVDVISVRHVIKRSKVDELLARYRVLILPAPMLTSDEVVEIAEKFVKQGGSLWVGYRSDLKDLRGQIRREASRLAKLAGIEIAEIESLNKEGLTATLKPTCVRGATAAKISVWREGLQIPNASLPPDQLISESSTVRAVWEYNDDFFGGQGYAAVTSRSDASGRDLVVYIGTGIDPEALVPLATACLKQQGVKTTEVVPDPNIEQVLRTDIHGQLMHVRINHGGARSTSLDPFEVKISKYQDLERYIL